MERVLYGSTEEYEEIERKLTSFWNQKSRGDNARESSTKKKSSSFT